MSERDKVCGKCFLTLPDTGEYFYLRTNKDGTIATRTYCKECEKDVAIQNYDKRRGKILDQKKEKYRRGLQKRK